MEILERIWEAVSLFFSSIPLGFSLGNPLLLLGTETLQLSLLFFNFLLALFFTFYRLGYKRRKINITNKNCLNLYTLGSHVFLHTGENRNLKQVLRFFEEEILCPGNRLTLFSQ